MGQGADERQPKTIETMVRVNDLNQWIVVLHGITSAGRLVNA
jgi:hypothetical protein